MQYLQWLRLIKIVRVLYYRERRDKGIIFFEFMMYLICLTQRSYKIYCNICNLFANHCHFEVENKIALTNKVCIKVIKMFLLRLCYVLWLFSKYYLPQNSCRCPFDPQANKSASSGKYNNLKINSFQLDL